MNNEEWILLAQLYFYRKYKTKKNMKKRAARRWWVRPLLQNRLNQGDGLNLIEEMRLTDKDKFHNYFRMSSDLFDILLGIVGPKINKLHLSREPISPTTKLALTLRYLASGDSMVSLHYAYRVSTASISEIISITTKAIWDTLQNVAFPELSEEMFLDIAETFWYDWNFPNCFGAIDGKHVTIQAPPHSGSNFYNYKNNHSIVLMACSDAKYCFTFVDIGVQGRKSDGGVFKNCALGQLLENKSLLIPKPCKLPNSSMMSPFVLVGDEAFQLTQYMMRPYPGRGGLDLPKKIFNYRLSRARRVIENAFGILSSAWRIYRRPLNASMNTNENIVKATVCLHNWLKRLEDKLPADQRSYCSAHLVDREEQGNVIAGSWRNEERGALENVHNVGGNRHSASAATIRDALKAYFVNEGAVEWQWTKATNNTD